ncbi:MAG: ATP-binding protein [Brooklawnia sp.]|jgi:predicted ATPase
MSDVGQRPQIGRTQELRALRQAWQTALTGRAGLVLVSGEAGIGKSTLVNEFVGGLGPEAQVLLGECLSFGTEAVPHAALSQILRTLAARVGVDALREWAGTGQTVLAALVPGPSRAPQAEPDRIQVFEAVADLLQAAARERPLLIIVEDLHWADPFTGHLLRFLNAALADSAGLLIVVTYRPDEIAGRHPLRPALAELQRRAALLLPLEPLNTDEITQLVRPLLPPHAEPTTIKRIVERSEGVPYFAEELARSTSMGGTLPATLREALLVRFLVLDRATQQLLRAATVIGVQFPFDPLVDLAGLDEATVGELLREAMNIGLLTYLDDEQYAFKHAMLRDVIHAEMLPGEHRRLHARYADILLAGRASDNRLDLIRHLRAGGRHQEAFVSALRQADELADAHPDCVDLYELALDLWDQVQGAEQVLGRYDEVLYRAAQANLWVGDHLRASRLIDASIAMLPARAAATERAQRLV